MNKFNNNLTSNVFCFNLNELNVFKSSVTLNVFFSFVCIKLQVIIEYNRSYIEVHSIF